MIDKFEKKLSVLGRSPSTFKNYTRHIAKMALHFDCLPTELEEDQMTDYLHFLKEQHNTPSASYFKHTVYGLRMLCKVEGLKPHDIGLPSIKGPNKLPVVLSKEEMWRLLCTPDLLKHKILIGLLYGCGLRCMEARSIRLKDIDFDRKTLHVVQGKGKKDRYVPLSEHLIRGLKQYIEAELPDEWLFNGQPMENRKGGDFESQSFQSIGYAICVMRSEYEVAHILARSWYKVTSLGLNSWQVRTLRSIKACRTIEMGGHVDVCNSCDHIQISYNSCRNRHCPKCQGQKRVQWIEAREAELLAVPHIHCIIPGGFVNQNGAWTPSKTEGKFLFPVKKENNDT